MSAGYCVEGFWASNYVERVVSPTDASPQYEFVFVTGQSIEYFNSTFPWNRHAKVVYVDGRDSPRLDWRGIRYCSFYLKRELLRFPLKPRNLMQVSFGIEQRYYEVGSLGKEWSEREIDLFCSMSKSTNPMRPLYLKLVEKISNEKSLRLFSESTGRELTTRVTLGRLRHPSTVPRWPNRRLLCLYSVLDRIALGSGRFWPRGHC